MLTILTIDPCDLVLTPNKSKINMCHVLTTTNQHVKYDSSGINCQENEGKPLFFKGPL